MSNVNVAHQVMHLAERLCQMGQQRRQVVHSSPLPDLAPVLAVVEKRLKLLEAALEAAKAKVLDTERQRLEGETFRGASLHEKFLFAVCLYVALAARLVVVAHVIGKGGRDMQLHVHHWPML